VRRRFRLRLALRGLAITLGFGLLALALSAWGMDHFRYTALAITAFRVFTWTALGGLVLRFLVLPLSTRLPDERVALYVEEHDPSLQAALLSAVELGSRARGAGAARRLSELSRRLVEQAERRCEEIDYRRLVERRSLQRMSGLFSGVATAGMVAALVSPAFIRQAVPFLLAPWNTGASRSPYAIRVEPGHGTVARGADQDIVAHLEGFDSDEVELAVQRGGAAGWERWPMTVEPGRPGHRFMLLDVGSRTEYFVEANGVRSELYRLDVVDVPYVARIDLQYRFPEYTGSRRRRSRTAATSRRSEALASSCGSRRRCRCRADGWWSRASRPRPLERGADGTLAGFRGRARGLLPDRAAHSRRPPPDGLARLRDRRPRGPAAAHPHAEAGPRRPGHLDRGSVHGGRGRGRLRLSKLELVYSIGGAPEKTVALHGGRR
jgi:hypothetical protein